MRFCQSSKPFAVLRPSSLHSVLAHSVPTMYVFCPSLISAKFKITRSQFWQHCACLSSIPFLEIDNREKLPFFDIKCCIFKGGCVRRKKRKKWVIEVWPKFHRWWDSKQKKHRIEKNTFLECRFSAIVNRPYPSLCPLKCQGVFLVNRLAVFRRSKARRSFFCRGL